MAYVRVAYDKVQPGKMAEAVTRIREGLVPLFEAQPGFVAYELIVCGDDSFVIVHTCETQADAESMMERASAWVRENIVSLIQSVDLHVVGELAISNRAG